jgi:hypothetical protein
VIFGKAGGGWGTTVGARQVLDLTDLSPADGFIIQGDVAGDQLGQSVSSAGDVNGDGIDDIIVGAFAGDDGGSEAGEAYVIFGKDGGGWGTTVGGRQVLDLTNLSPTDGFIIQGDVAGDQLGYSVSSAGDVNGDGIDDIIVGARQGDDGGSNAGEAYVIFGKAGGGWGAEVGGRQVLDLTNLSPTDGFIIQGDVANDLLGISVSSAGDVNGDGIDDIIVGANGGDDGGSAAGEAYVIFGKADGSWGTEVGGRQVLDLTNLAPEDGFIIQGDAANDELGVAVSSAGDVNGDGYDDLIVGAHLGDDGGSNAGEAYVIYGRPDMGGLFRAGSSYDDWIAGSDMGDQLDGRGGADTLLGYGGNDLLIVADTKFARIDGGDGIDTLMLDGSGISLDFTQIAQGKVTGIEKLDIGGSGANEVTLRLSDVLALSPTESVDGEPGTAILINGDADDTVNLASTLAGADSGAWSLAGQQTVNGVDYDVYVNAADADVRVLIDQEITNVALSVV